jgi:tRNA pseudouridine55 synthase
LLRGRDAPLALAEAYATTKNTLVAIGSVEQGQFIPRRVFKNAG